MYQQIWQKAVGSTMQVHYLARESMSSSFASRNQLRRDQQVAVTLARRYEGKIPFKPVEDIAQINLQYNKSHQQTKYLQPPIHIQTISPTPTHAHHVTFSCHCKPKSHVYTHKSMQ